MSSNDLEDRYQQAMQQLSELVQQRDRCLAELETLATLPLSISPRSGHVGEFDLAQARDVLESLEQQTVLIQQGMETVNEIAGQMQRTTVTWLKMPRSKGEG